MKHAGAKLAATLTAIAAAAGLAAGLGLTPDANAVATKPTHQQATPPTTATTPHYVVLDCAGKPKAKPGTFTITCADGGIGVQSLHWTSWAPQLASGYGTFWENDCTPDCASGHFHHYPALAVFWGSASIKGYPADRRYTKLTLIFNGKTRPPVYSLKNGKLVATYPQTQTFDAY